MGHYFLQTTMVSGKIRLRALPGQQFNDGRSVLTKLDIQASKAVRDRNPLGTIFHVDNLEERTSQDKETPFLAAIGCLIPMNNPSDPLQPNEAMKAAWTTYQLANNIPQQGGLFEQEEVPEPGQKKSLLGEIRTDTRKALPTIEKDGFAVDRRQWEMTMVFISNHDNLLLTGPSGTGKTELVMLACKRLGIECRKYNMGTMSDPMSAMLGVHRIKDGKSVFEPAQFLEDIQKPGVILLDELNRAPLTAMNYLMSCLDGTREMRNDYVSPVQRVKVHPECTFVATANIGSEFVGTNIIDPAIDSRFFRLRLNYPEADNEKRVLMKRYGIEEKHAKIIVKVANNVRNNYLKGELSNTLTVRQTLMAAKLISCGYQAVEAMEQIFLPYFEGTENDGEMATVKKIIYSC